MPKTVDAPGNCDGQWAGTGAVLPSTPECITTINPANAQVLAHYAVMTDAEVEHRLSQHVQARGIWALLPLTGRAAIWQRLACLLREGGETFARTITAEMGKPLRESRAEVEKSAATLEWFASHGPRWLADEPVKAEGQDQVHVSYRPLGSVLGVMPWNFPLWQVIRAAGPIMLAGNGFVLKHAANVLGCAQMIERLFAQAGVPQAAFCHLIIGHGQVPTLIADARIDGVTLTGSGRAGAAVAAQAGAAMKKSLLELGGSDAFIVLADADIEAAVQAAVTSRFANAGQVCLAAKRFLLEHSIAAEFTQRLVAAVAALKVGDPMDDATDIGPLARLDLRDALHAQVQQSIDAGAELLLGGAPIAGDRAFYAPTVLADVTPGMPVFDEETFGPVAALTTVRDAEEAIALANASRFGLSAAVWTRDAERAQHLAARLRVGGVFINTYAASNPCIPVGGVKQSGYGRELSHFGLREFTNAQAVWAKA